MHLSVCAQTFGIDRKLLPLRTTIRMCACDKRAARGAEKKGCVMPDMCCIQSYAAWCACCSWLAELIDNTIAVIRESYVCCTSLTCSVPYVI